MISAAALLAHCRAVLLDMDGTLVNSHAAVEATWKTWARDNGLDPAAVLAVCHGPDAATTVRRFLPDIGAAELARHVAAHLERECALADGVLPAPGAPELVAWLNERSLPWGVVTNAHLRLARARLGAAGIEASSPSTTSSTASPTRRGTCWVRGAWGSSPPGRPGWRTPPPVWRRRGPRGRSSWRWAGPGTATSCAATCTNCAGS